MTEYREYRFGQSTIDDIVRKLKIKKGVYVKSVAGSGKTSKIIEICKRAKEIVGCEQMDEQILSGKSRSVRILIVCFNRMLTNKTKERLSQIGEAEGCISINIECHTFHSCALFHYNTRQTSDEAIIECLGLSPKQDGIKYDIFIIDECQDMTHHYAKFIDKLIVDYLSTDIECPYVCILGDENQLIYKFKGACISNTYWLMRSLEDRYKMLHFNIIESTVSYRITKSMACLLKLGYGINIESCGESKVVDYPVRLINTDNRWYCAYRECMYYLSIGYSESDIYIISTSVRSPNPRSSMKYMQEMLTSKRIVIEITSMSSGIYTCDQKLVISSVHGLKGMENKVVIFVMFDETFDSMFKPSKDSCSNEMYVALTRASERLSLIRSVDCDLPLNYKKCKLSRDNNLQSIIEYSILFYNIEKIVDIYSPKLNVEIQDSKYLLKCICGNKLELSEYFLRERTENYLYNMCVKCIDSHLSNNLDKYEYAEIYKNFNPEFLHEDSDSFLYFSEASFSKADITEIEINPSGNVPFCPSGNLPFSSTPIDINDKFAGESQRASQAEMFACLNEIDKQPLTKTVSISKLLSFIEIDIIIDIIKRLNLSQICNTLDSSLETLSLAAESSSIQTTDRQPSNETQFLDRRDSKIVDLNIFTEFTEVNWPTINLEDEQIQQVRNSKDEYIDIYESTHGIALRVIKFIIEYKYTSNLQILNEYYIYSQLAQMIYTSDIYKNIESIVNDKKSLAKYVKSVLSWTLSSGSRDAVDGNDKLRKKLNSECIKLLVSMSLIDEMKTVGGYSHRYTHQFTNIDKVVDFNKLAILCDKSVKKIDSLLSNILAEAPPMPTVALRSRQTSCSLADTGSLLSEGKRGRLVAGVDLNKTNKSNRYNLEFNKNGKLLISEQQGLQTRPFNVTARCDACIDNMGWIFIHEQYDNASNLIEYLLTMHILSLDCIFVVNFYRGTCTKFIKCTDLNAVESIIRELYEYKYGRNSECDNNGTFPFRKEDYIV